MQDQIKRYGIYIVAAIVAIAMIVISLVTPNWTIEKQIALIGQIVAVLSALLAAKFSNPNKVITEKVDSPSVAQDTVPTPEELIQGTDDEGETIEGPEGR